MVVAVKFCRTLFVFYIYLAAKHFREESATPVPPGTDDSSPLRFRGAAPALRNKWRENRQIRTFLAPQAGAQRSEALQNPTYW